VSDAHPNREQLDSLFRTDAFMDSLGMRLEQWSGGRARVSYTASAEHGNFSGLLHGGVIFSVGDAAFAVASNSWGRQAVALSIDVHYLSAPEHEVVLTADARERSRTRRTASYAIEVSSPAGLVASLHAMVYRSGAWHFGEDAWPDAWRAAH
jgi:acyl-CoA thioesterase